MDRGNRSRLKQDGLKTGRAVSPREGTQGNCKLRPTGKKGGAASQAHGDLWVAWVISRLKKKKGGKGKRTHLSTGDRQMAQLILSLDGGRNGRTRRRRYSVNGVVKVGLPSKK